MKKHLKALLAFFLFFTVLGWYCYLVNRYTTIMMWISLGIVVAIVYTAFYKIINNE